MTEQKRNDLISRGALYDALRRLADETDCNIAVLPDVAALIREAPAAEVERAQARWVYDPDGMDFNLGAWVCSRCGTKNDNFWHRPDLSPYGFVGSRYCPNCGAKMGGGVDADAT